MGWGDRGKLRQRCRIGPMLLSVWWRWSPLVAEHHRSLVTAPQSTAARFTGDDTPEAGAWSGHALGLSPSLYFPKLCQLATPSFLNAQVTLRLFYSWYVPQPDRKFEKRSVWLAWKWFASPMRTSFQAHPRSVPEKPPLSLCSSGSGCIFHSIELKGTTDPVPSPPSQAGGWHWCGAMGAAAALPPCWTWSVVVLASKGVAELKGN